MKKTGIIIIKASVILFIISALPLILYIIFGPADGNPVGLGLLLFAGGLLAQTGFSIGLTFVGIAYFKDKEKSKLIK